MQTIEKPNVIAGPFARNGLKNNIPENPTGTYLASVDEGFPAITMQPLALGGTPPDGKDFNGIFNLMSQFYFAFQNGWWPTFDPEVSQAIGGYPQDSILWYLSPEDGRVRTLKSLIPNNTYDFNANPDYIGTYWDDALVAQNGASLPILVKYVSDFQLNDMSWLNADTFTWHPGETYEQVYQHLSDDMAGGTASTVTIEDITINYILAADGHRICAPDQEEKIVSLYASAQDANFYILDVENQRFKLPRTKQRQLIRSVTRPDNSWYNLYSDGWVEQGGQILATQTSQPKVPANLTIPVKLPYQKSKMFGAGVAGNSGLGWDSVANTVSGGSEDTSTVAYFSVPSFSYITYAQWRVCGYATDSVMANEPVVREYYYVGNFSANSIKNTAGLNAELFNKKVDVGHQLVEYQTPTAENNYTWYRKYADGWVEQGGYLGSSNPLRVTVTYAVPMSDTNYTLVLGTFGAGQTGGQNQGWSTRTTTSFVYTFYNTGTGGGNGGSWMVYGIAASTNE